MNYYTLKKFNERIISMLNLFGLLLYIIVDPDNDVFQGNFPASNDLNSKYSMWHSSFKIFLELKL